MVVNSNQNGPFEHARLFRFWDRARASYWFVPSLMTAGAALVLAGTLGAGYAWPGLVQRALGGLSPDGPQAVRTILATVAGSVITIAGVAFSVVIVAMSLASQQLGPRVLMSFRSDRGIQVVLGSFLATFLYCLLMLYYVGGNADEVPPEAHLAVLIALLLGLGSLAMLIYFIHHAAATIQADHVIAAIGRDLDETIDRLLPPPQSMGASRDGPLCPAGPEAPWADVLAHKCGYVQAIEEAGLIRLASEHDLLIRLEVRAGKFVLHHSVVARVCPAGQLTEPIARAIRLAVVLGSQRTHAHDPEFGLEQLAEVAVRALSPGTNDPFTAVRCVDRLAAALSRAMGRALPPTRRYDRAGTLRLISQAVHWSGLIDAALHPIRQHSVGTVSVAIRLMEAIGSLAGAVECREQRVALLRQAGLILRDNRPAIGNDSDRADLEQRYEQAVEALKQKTPGIGPGVEGADRIEADYR